MVNVRINLRPSITGISVAPPTACKMPSGSKIHGSKNVHVKLNSSRENPTY